jgi:hypothetical protein
VNQADHDPVFDTPDEVDVRTARAVKTADAKSKRDAEDQTLAWIMKGPRGRAFVWRLIEHAAIFHSSYQPHAVAMAHAEGLKSQGYWLLAQVRRVCPELEITMMQENV